MRKDMAKKLVETHRTPPGITYKETRTTGNDSRFYEEAPKRERMMQRYGYKTKEFGENFPPLLGYLRKNCGRKWNDVYSELCTSLKGGGTVIEHVKVHLFRDFLVEKPQWIDGKPHTQHWWSGWAELSEGTFYVDKKGILKVVPESSKKRKKKKDCDFLFVSPQKQYRRINDVWFELTIDKLPSNPMETGKLYYDALLKKTIVGFKPKGVDYFGKPLRPYWRFLGDTKNMEYKLSRLYPGYPIKTYAYASNKRQLSSKEIKKLGLNKGGK